MGHMRKVSFILVFMVFMGLSTVSGFAAKPFVVEERLDQYTSQLSFYYLTKSTSCLTYGLVAHGFKIDLNNYYYAGRINVNSGHLLSNITADVEVWEIDNGTYTCIDSRRHEENDTRYFEFGSDISFDSSCYYGLVAEVEFYCSTCENDGSASFSTKFISVYDH